MSSILKVDQLQDSGGNAIITSDGSGNITTQKLLYPAFEATRTADQTLTNATITKVEFNVENLDTDNCYDATTNYRFLPTLAGKYFVYTVLRGDSAASSQGEYVVGYIYKNGTAVKSALVDMRLNPGRQASVALNAILDMNGTTDYVESYINFETTGSTAKAESASGSLTFGAYRIGGYRPSYDKYTANYIK
jgi:hypothetical protein